MRLRFVHQHRQYINKSAVFIFINFNSSCATPDATTECQKCYCRLSSSMIVYNDYSTSMLVSCEKNSFLNL